MEKYTKIICIVLGVVFLLVGLLGYISNPIVWSEWFFHTNGVHNIVHLLTWTLFILFWTIWEENGSLFMKVFGIVYLLVAFLGFMSDKWEETFSILGLIQANAMDNYLHIILWIVIVALWFMTCKKS